MAEPLDFRSLFQRSTPTRQSPEDAPYAEAYEKLVRFLARSIVGDSVDVRTEVSIDRGVLTVGLLVPESERGRVIGRGGSTARSLRTILDAATLGSPYRVTLDIRD